MVDIVPCVFQLGVSSAILLRSWGKPDASTAYRLALVTVFNLH
ncbi:hypothetical protein D556_2921 [Bordetella holmesii 41130]|nr:hypothetical protein D556_2921 [Bordetella holmesii 41130]